jgi:hypothetical protein
MEVKIYDHYSMQSPGDCGTYYEFNPDPESDGVCSGIAHCSDITQRMVQDTLGPNGLPLKASPPACVFADSIETWFIEDTSSANQKEWVIELTDSLEFTDLGNGTYQFIGANMYLLDDIYARTGQQTLVDMGIENTFNDADNRCYDGNNITYG